MRDERITHNVSVVAFSVATRLVDMQFMLSIYCP